MFSWVNGLKTASGNAPQDTSFVQEPETPAAALFAVHAFKHALYGTPAADDTRSIKRKSSKETAIRHTLESRWANLGPPDSPPLPPTKPNGILMTPGTVNTRRKQVTFGSQIMGGESKTDEVEYLEDPNDVPGKLHNPFASKKKAREERLRNLPANRQDEGREPLTKAEELLGTSRNRGHARSKSANDQDEHEQTIDFDHPRSDSGRYWKEAFESYSERSEAETKVLISKARLAKDFAKKKDQEALELKLALDNERRKMEIERAKRRQREVSLEAEIRDLREKLRIQLSENARTTAELANLKRRLDPLDGKASGNPGALSEAEYAKYQASRADSAQSDVSGEDSDTARAAAEFGRSHENSLAIWAAAGEDADPRRSVETIKSAQSQNHIIDQLSAASGSLRSKRGESKGPKDLQLRRTTSAREMREPKERSSSSSNASTGSDSISPSETVSDTAVLRPIQTSTNTYNPTPLSPIQGSPAIQTPSQERQIDDPSQGSRHARSSQYYPTNSSPTLPLTMLSPNVILKAGGSTNQTIAPAVPPKDSSSSQAVKASSTKPGRNDGDTEIIFNATAPISALEAKTLDIINASDRSSKETMRSTNSSSPVRPSTATSSSSTAAGLTTLKNSRHAQQRSVDTAGDYNKENPVGEGKTKIRRNKNSGAIIDGQRMEAARARIAARKVMQSNN